MRTYLLPHPSKLERTLWSALNPTRTPSAQWRIFSNGEMSLRILRVSPFSVVIGRTAPPSENILRTALLIDTLRRNGAQKIVAVIPYFGYGRQDRKVYAGDGVPADCFTALLKAATLDVLITVDLHSDLTRQHAAFPIISLESIGAFAHVLERKLPRAACTVVAPDAGAFARAQACATLLSRPASVAWIKKTRGRSGTAHAHEVHGTLRGTIAIVVDDILDTGGTLKETVRILRASGMKQVYVCITHGIFSGAAIRTISQLGLETIFVSDTVSLSLQVRRALPICVISIAPLILSRLRRFVRGHNPEFSNKRVVRP